VLARNLHASAAICVLVVGSTAANAQALLIPGGANATEIIARAEAEGAAFRRVPNPGVLPTSFTSLLDRRTLPEILGSGALPPNKHAEGRSCVVGQGSGPNRSGEFVIGGNLGGREAMVAGRVGKVWWSPMHHARDMPPLLVRGRSLTVPSDTVRFATDQVASVGGRLERQYFFPSGISVPQPGRWLLIATSGANWGCFILTVR